MSKTDFKSFYTTPNFEAWQDEKFVYIHLMERGLDISFFKDDFRQFVIDVTETLSKLEESK
tara:strand:+ start:73 stop:255 length:183 start_codon:yes stop_codon:yes gene_type:complete